MVKPRGRRSSSNKSDSTEESKFSVYDFGAEDDRMEKDAQKLLSKFKSAKPTKFSVSPLTKYKFLEFFTGGTVENDCANEPMNVDEYVHDMEGRTPKLGSAVSSPSDCEELAAPSCSSPMEKAGSRKSRKPGGSWTDIQCRRSFRPGILADNLPFCLDSDGDQEEGESLQGKPICVDSDDDLRTDFKKSNVASDIARDEGSLKEQQANYDSNTLQDEPTVVINPDCIFLGDIYSTTSMLTFSSKSIKLKGPILDGTGSFCDFNWPISDIMKIKSTWNREVETVMVGLLLKFEDEKLTGIASRFSENEGVLELKFSVNDPNWCERQEAIRLLDSRYEAIWDIVEDFDPTRSGFSFLEEKSMASSKVCSANEAFEDIIYPEGDPDAVSISKKDIELLQPATFINDTIVDFYVKYLQQNIKADQKHRFHFFNSFFFRKLADLDKDLSSACEGRAAFQCVRKWTRKVNLFEKDYLFIPVNFSLHWSLVIVCHPGEAVHRRHEALEKSSKVPCILHMDPIRGYHRGLKNIFQSYLWEEWKERHINLREDVHTNFLNLPYISLELPQQGNAFDCGLFLLYYVERFLQHAPVNFNPFNNTSNFLNKEWFQPAEASGRRDYIKKLVYKIYHDKHPPAVDEAKDSSLEVVEDNSGKGFFLEMRDRVEACQADDFALNAEEFQKIPQAGTPGRSPRYLLQPNLIHGLTSSERDAEYFAFERTCQHHGKLISLKQTCNLMSPIEEGKTTGEKAALSSTYKASEQNAAATVSGIRTNLDRKDLKISTGRSPILLKLQGEDKPVNEVFLVSASEEGNKRNETASMSSEELSACVVEDSDGENGMIVIDADINSHKTGARTCFFVG